MMRRFHKGQEYHGVICARCAALHVNALPSHCARCGMEFKQVEAPLEFAVVGIDYGSRSITLSSGRFERAVAK